MVLQIGSIQFYTTPKTNQFYRILYRLISYILINVKFIYLLVQYTLFFLTGGQLALRWKRVRSKAHL